MWLGVFAAVRLYNPQRCQNALVEERVRLDLVYVQNWTVLLDLSILLRTVPAVVGGRGAY